MLPTASEIGKRAPIAAAIGSSTRYTSRAPAFLTASSTARFSTSVTSDGIPITTRGRGKSENASLWTFRIKYLSISSVTSKSDTTPATKGRVATIWAGVRPTMRFASAPIATICPLFCFSADRNNLPAFLIYRNDRGLVNHNAPAANIHQGICRTQINAYIMRELTEESVQHNKTPHGSFF